MKVNLISLLTEIINEVGDFSNIEPYEYNLTDIGGDFTIENKYKAKVVIMEWGDNTEFKFPPIVENPSSRPIYNIGYEIEGSAEQFLRSNYKILIKILKTVSLIVEEHIKQLDSKNPIFTIFSTGKKGVGYEDPQKMILYKEILSKNLPSDYRIGMGEQISLKSKFIYITK
jgi:hypothetical protein